MSTNPFSYALSRITAPAGRLLWLYGDPDIASGDVYHVWKDQVDGLGRKGCNIFSEIEAMGKDYDAVFVNCPKQREQAEGLMALALERSRGFVMAAGRKDAGGSRLKDMLQAYGLSVESLSKSRSKIVWTMESTKADRAQIARNRSHLVPRRIAMADGEWWSLPGLFGWNKIDPGSRLLLEYLPADLNGNIADFGCGYGYLSVMASRRFAGITAIDAYDADARAVDCAARNGEGKVNAIWQDIRTLETERKYDAIIMNPPFHTGKQEDLALGQCFIRKAWASLKPGCSVFMVANRSLPYEKVIPGLGILAERDGYKILAGRAP